MMIFIIILTLIILALIILSLIILIILIFSFQNAGFPMNPFDISQGLEILGPWPMARCSDSFAIGLDGTLPLRNCCLR